VIDCSIRIFWLKIYCLSIYCLNTLVLETNMKLPGDACSWKSSVSKYHMSVISRSCPLYKWLPDYTSNYITSIWQLLHNTASSQNVRSKNFPITEIDPIRADKHNYPAYLLVCHCQYVVIILIILVSLSITPCWWWLFSFLFYSNWVLHGKWWLQVVNPIGGLNGSKLYNLKR